MTHLNDPFGIKMLTRLRLGFSYLCEHKFNNGFKENLNSLVPVVLKLKPKHTISCCATLIQTEPPL